MNQNDSNINTNNSTKSQFNPDPNQFPSKHRNLGCWETTPYGHLDQVGPTQAYSYKQLPNQYHHVVAESVFESIVGVPSYGHNPNPVFQFHHQQGAHSAYYATLDAAYGVNAGVPLPNTANPFHRNANSNSARKKMKIVQVHWCEVCNIACDTENVLDLHKLGKKHKNNVEKLRGRPTNNNPFHRNTNHNSTHKKTLVVQWCEVCKIACDTKAVLDIHETGTKHRENLEKLKSHTNSSPAPARPPITPSANI